MEAGPQKNIEKIWEEFGKHRDPQTRNLLLLHYLSEVKYAAERVFARLPKSVEFQELLQDGALGLMKAIDKFDPQRGVKFETYCPRRIEGAILDEIRKKDRVPRLVRRRARQLKKVTQKLESIFGRPPTETELAEELGMDESKFYDFLREANASTLFSLSKEFAGADGQEDFHEGGGIADQKSPDPVLQAQARDLKEFIRQGFSREEQMIVTLYHFEGMTMKEIGKTLGISESRVCQIHSSVFARLRDRAHRQAGYDNLVPERKS